MLALLGTITINLDPVLVKFGPFALRWYGLMYVLGIALGLVVLFPYTRRLGIAADFAFERLQVFNLLRRHPCLPGVLQLRQRQILLLTLPRPCPETVLGMGVVDAELFGLLLNLLSSPREPVDHGDSD